VLAYPLPGVWRKLFVMSRNAIASGEKLR